MPNWCGNSLKIFGDDDEVAKFMEENINEDNELSFAMSCPDPDAATDDDYQNSWCIENWGTKWDARECEIDDCDNCIYFNTAWAPPEAWLEKVAEKYSSLQFTLRYEEGGCDFSGVLEYVDGKLVNDEDGCCGEYYGSKYCYHCEEYFEWDCCGLGGDWKHDFHICVECYDNASKIIKSAVRSKKIEKLPKMLACRRMGRNPIMDNYLMCKVFIPRLNECVA